MSAPHPFGQRVPEDVLPPQRDDNDPLYMAALEVERVEQLNLEMAEWDATVADGLAGPADKDSRG